MVVSGQYSGWWRRLVAGSRGKGVASGGLEAIWKQWMFLSLPISTGRRQLLISDVSVRWGYKVRVIRQRSVITGQCWEVHSYS